MRKIVVSEYLSLDGVMEDPGGAEQFEHGGWTRPYFSDDLGKYKFDELFMSDTLLLGRVTYQGFSAAWPQMSETEGEFANMMNGYPKYVVSTTLKAVDWNNSHLINQNAADEIAKLKQQPGKDIMVAGSCKLAQMLLQHNLIDEYHLQVHPIVLGSGKRLFQDGAEAILKLVDAKPFTSGVIALTYQPIPGK